MNKTQKTLLSFTVLAALAAAISAEARSEDRFMPARTQDQPAESLPQPGIRLTEREILLELGADFLPKFFHHDAELEATSVEFERDFHFGADEWHDHRVEAVITNIDTVWSGGLRHWEIHSFPSGGGSYLVDQGSILPLAPGQEQFIVRALPANVDPAAVYVLLLSPGDADASNDLAVSSP